MTFRRVVVAIAVVLAGWGAVLGVRRVFSLESNELERVVERTLEATADENAAEPSRRLLEVELAAGEDVLFEVCARDGLPEDRWAGAVDFAVWNPDAGELVVSAPLDRDLLRRAQRSSQGACVVVASGKLEIAGPYALEAVWPERTLPPDLASVPLRARVIAHSRLEGGDRLPVWLVLAGMLLGVVGLVRWRGAGGAAAVTGRGPLVRVLLGVGALVVAILVLAYVPFWGSTAGLLRGVVLAAVQVLAAVFLVVRIAGGTTRAEALGLVAPLPGSTSRGRRLAAWLTLVLAPVVGFGLWIVGGMIADLVPATGEAPIEAFASWPSGTLSVAIVAVIAPVAEEVFFRGLIYGTAERRFGWRIAFVLSLLLFAVAHLPQQWGAWGAFASVLFTGAVLTGLRAATRSTLVSVVAHLGHNLTIAVLATSLS